MDQPVNKYLAGSLLPLLKGIKATGGDSNLIWTARRVVRRWTEFPELTGKPNLDSRQALLLAQSRDIAPQTLRRATYLDQCKKSGLKDPSHGKGGFHHEHMTPVSQLVKGLLEIEDPTEADIIAYIGEKALVAWITKEEQRALDSVCKSGHRTPALLEALGIELL